MVLWFIWSFSRSLLFALAFPQTTDPALESSKRARKDRTGEDSVAKEQPQQVDDTSPRADPPQVLAQDTDDEDEVIAKPATTSAPPPAASLPVAPNAGSPHVHPPHDTVNIDEVDDPAAAEQADAEQAAAIEKAMAYEAAAAERAAAIDNAVIDGDEVVRILQNLPPAIAVSPKTACPQDYLDINTQVAMEAAILGQEAQEQEALEHELTERPPPSVATPPRLGRVSFPSRRQVCCFSINLVSFIKVLLYLKSLGYVS